MALGTGKGSGTDPWISTPHTCRGSHRPWLFSFSPRSFQLKRRSSRSKCCGDSEVSREIRLGLRVPYIARTLEPVHPSRAKGNWLAGATTRSTRTAFQAGWGFEEDFSPAVPRGCGRRKMQKLLSKASMEWLCRVSWAASL